jgi:hypothetical protein
LFSATAQPRNRATAQPREKRRNSFSPNCLSIWHRPGFDSDCPEFQIGAHDANDLDSFLSRCDAALASVQNAANLAALKLKGWAEGETTAFQTARTAFGPAEQYRVQQISGAKDTTTQKNNDAATPYENILTIQNAADLERPAADPANAGVRGEFLLGIFPPDHGGNHTPPPTLLQTPAK